MCGFIGRIFSCPGAAQSLLTGALPYLHRRGPDSHSVWHSDDRTVELLHTRLAIVDSDPRATQPLVDQKHGLVVVFNGEIYNYPELRRDLAAYPFHTSSDTEVILAAYALHGLAGLNRLRGMYSLALVDIRARRVFVARDPVGKKPLFIARWGQAVLFGSSVLALVAAQAHRPEINSEAVEFFWRESFIRPDQCLLRGVAPVFPGQVVELDWQGVERQRHVQAPSAGRRYEGEPFAEAAATVAHLLEQAVERRLRDSPQPAVLCSGGIDSTVITLIAAKIARQGALCAPLKVLTLGALLPLSNDELFARYATARIGLSLEVVRPGIRRLRQQLRDCLTQQDEPLAMISFYPLAELVSAVASRSRVLLTGDGGDEVFLGYGRPAMWKHAGGEGERVEATHVPCGPPVPAWMSAWGASMVTDHLVGHGFAKVDRASAEQAVEVRCPLVDWDLMTYVRTVPFEMLTRGGVMKALLKDQLQGWPNWFLERRKMGFVINLRWMWGLIGYEGLRDRVSPEAQRLFDEQLPVPLRKPPMSWSLRDMFCHFTTAWRLYVWSDFLRRLQSASPDGLR